MTPITTRQHNANWYLKTQVHELGFAECPKSFVFRGTKDYAPKQVQEMLGLTGATVRPGQPAARPGQPPQMSMAANRYTTNRFLDG